MLNTLGEYDHDTKEHLSDLGNGYRINLDYFAMEKYHKKRSAPPMTDLPGRPARWSGTAYYSLSVGDKTLRFKQPRNTFHEQGDCCGFYHLGSREGLDYVFWNGRDYLNHPNLNQVYLIRKKS